MSETLRLMWMGTRYEPGTLMVIVYDKDGNAVAEKEVNGSVNRSI
ncbi:hypothetical protein M2459_002367 [Parabacteroides sp. PF5-5]|nr:hypothetical protein [Parabacteroides sp. PH5-39]MDH6316620.1 hypothetical protein [Parabacteroides sp. PF5-13]MDH6320200.1 hypothetical protein [Parabacteroides sp. PH5-13]MDH6323857.1 hypothetical protein [Parabacteroides sp. PH5-8]MDH6327877.1 hypothetical protein [Parabacteroides sp. PH5-41]MDH6335607.1 hypothetical protein [Parabacteroides sp. PF5-5]MDH6346741.1 hypothetical protein [Parabacteroides sp. PH5-46]MDH6361633.1 hypothetical protein [Parabacteroides sp. PH5-16]MDH6377300.